MNLTQDDLQPFFAFNLPMTELGVFLITKKDVLTNSVILTEKISEACENVQDAVWNKKFSTSENTVAHDYLLLVWDRNGQRVVGFLSSSCFSDQVPLRHIIYHSDAMILKEYRGLGIYKALMYFVNTLVRRSYPNEEILNIVASGYIFAFKCYEENQSFLPIEWTKEERFKKSIVEILRRDFPDSEIKDDGVIRAAWRQQKNGMADVWGHEVAERYSFPKDVNYFEGDIFVRLYKLKSNLAFSYSGEL